MYQKVGIPLLKFSGKTPIPIEQSFGGEIGAFYFVPFIASFLKVSSSDAALIFFTSLISFGVFTSTCFFFVLAENKVSKTLAFILPSFLGLLCYAVGDVYCVYFFITALFLPLFFLLESKSYSFLLIYSVFFGVIGFYANFVRSHSFLPLIVAFLVIICMHFDFKKSIFLIVLLCIGHYIGHLHIQYVISQRNDYLRENGYKIEKTNKQHTFWHAVYAGCGFISNDKNLYFSDSCSANAVAQINSSVPYLSPEYESILKHNVLRIMFKSPHYFMRVIFAKLGVLLYFFFLFANIGIIAAYYYPKPLYIELGYAVLLFVSALPGLLTIPITTYLLGFITATFFYALHSLIYALNKIF